MLFSRQAQRAAAAAAALESAIRFYSPPAVHMHITIVPKFPIGNEYRGATVQDTSKIGDRAHVAIPTTAIIVFNV